MKFVNTKICKRCKEDKSLDLFYKDSSSNDGYCITCKSCKFETSSNKKKTVFGLIDKMYWSQCSSSINRNMPRPKYSKQEFIEWIIFNPVFKKLYYDWVNSDYNKMMIPSVDRINDYKGYEFGNIQLMTWKENDAKNHRDIYNGINAKRSRSILVYKKGIFYKRYNSISLAARELKITTQNIQPVLNGREKQLNGFVFLYENSTEEDIKKRSCYIKNDTGVIGVNKITGEVLEFDSIKEAQIKTKSFNISEVCSGTRKSSNGFNWKYKNGGTDLSNL